MLVAADVDYKNELYRKNLNSLVKTIESAVGLSGADVPREVCRALQTSFAPGDWLTPEQHEGRETAYTRHLVYEDPEGRFTIVSLVWNPGQASPIHAHYVWCALTIIEGGLQEEFYAFNQETETATFESAHQRKNLDGSYGLPDTTQYHRISNTTSDRAVSVHVYGIDGARVSTNVNRIFKDTK